MYEYLPTIDEDMSKFSSYGAWAYTYMYISVYSPPVCTYLDTRQSAMRTLGCQVILQITWMSGVSVRNLQSHVPP